MTSRKRTQQKPPRKPRRDRVLRKKVRDFLAGIGIRLLAPAVTLLPRALVWRIGRGAGWVLYYLLPRHRRIARANLDLAFGDQKSPGQKARIARASLQNFAATMALLFWSPRLNRHNYTEFVEFDSSGLRLVREAVARGRGTIFLTLHYGDWELTGLTMGFLGIPLTIVAERLPNPVLARATLDFRRQSGNRIYEQPWGAIRLFRALKRGGYPTLLNDLNAKRRGGIWVNFFGLPVLNHLTPAALAAFSGAPVIYGISHPLGKGRTKIEFAEIPYQRTGSRAADLRRISQSCADFCEQVIRRCPEHWHWSYKRWKRRPTPQRGSYPFYSRYLRVEESAALSK